MTENPNHTSRGFIANVLLKALVLFLILNFTFALANPLPAIGRVSLYNWLLPGRQRLPYGEDSAKAYNLSLFNLEAMFAAHEIAVPKTADEIRVILLGDSSVWGYWLENEHTLAAYLNAAQLTSAEGKRVVVYNLGYPTISLTKDLLILDYALRYQPDLVVWLFTLESFPYDKQLFTPLVQHNPERTRALIADYDLQLAPRSPDFVEPDWWGRTIIGQRRALADMLRLQLYGFLWAATGIDQDIPFYADPEDYKTLQKDFTADESYHDLSSPLQIEDLAFDVLTAGAARVGDVPILFVNEPMYIGQGENNQLRYNFFYPRWVYDEYRALMAQFCAQNDLPYLDLWDALPPEEFTNTPIHLTPQGSEMLAKMMQDALLAMINGQ